MEKGALAGDGRTATGPPPDLEEVTIDHLRSAGGSLRIGELVARLRDAEADPVPLPETTATYERLVVDVLPRLVREGQVVYSREDRTVTLLADDSPTLRSRLEPGVGPGLIVFTSLLFGIGTLSGIGFSIGLGIAVVAGTGVYLLRGGERASRAASSDAASSRPADDRSRSPEHQLLELLLADGGVAEQSTLADRLDCAKSTVSRRLSRLQEDDLVRKVSAGRKKVVFLRGVAPAGPSADERA